MHKLSPCLARQMLIIFNVRGLENNIFNGTNIVVLLTVAVTIHNSRRAADILEDNMLNVRDLSY